MGVAKPASTILASTPWARSRARPGFQAGEYLDGAFSRPASTAASAIVTSLAPLLKKRRAAASTP